VNLTVSSIDMVLVCTCIVVLPGALRRYHEVNAEAPKYVVVYRDGVGDGQVLTVQQHEVPQVSAALRSSAPQ